MTTNTDALIKELSERLDPAPPLHGPWVRTLLSLAILGPYAVLAVLIMHAVLGHPAPVVDARFVIEQVFALSTGIAAAVAAFTSVIPGRSRTYLLWPLLPLMGWLGTLGEGCLRAGFGEATLHHNLSCFPFIVVFGAAPAGVLWVMLRRGAPLTPRLTVALGALAAAGLGNFCVRLVHPEDVTVMLLVWHAGGVVLLTALASASGRYLLNWGSISGPVRRSNR
jgi:hypothetical protein